AHEWLFFVLCSWIMGAAGFEGLTVFKTLLVLGGFVPHILWWRRHPVAVWWAPSLILLAAYAQSQRMILRSSLVTELAAVWLVHLLLKVWHGELGRLTARWIVF